MTTLIRWNYPRVDAVPNPDPIDDILTRLQSLTLAPSLEPFAVPSLEIPNGTHFFGNFLAESAGFAVDTNDPDVIRRLNDAIRANVGTPAFKQAKNEYEYRIANKGAPRSRAY